MKVCKQCGKEIQEQECKQVFGVAEEFIELIVPVPTTLVYCPDCKIAFLEQEEVPSRIITLE